MEIEGVNMIECNLNYHILLPGFDTIILSTDLSSLK